jgi:hypothetical protein
MPRGAGWLRPARAARLRPQRREPAAEARDPAFQDQLMDRLAELTGVALV